MSENGKTLTFVGVALALAVIAVIARPKVEPLKPNEIVGKALFDKFTDADKANSLKIVKYAEDVGQISSFEVARNASGLWTIPSHGNYPADADTQMKDAATALVNLTVLGVASEDPGDHSLFGVLEPDAEKLKLGDKGVGLLVSFQDETGSTLGSLVIGKEVKGTPDQRFVRVPRQDKVFVVKISPDKLSTKFEDWIEKDLLKLSTFDVERLRLKDHSVVQTTQGFVAQPRAEVAVSLDANGANWKLDEMIVHKEGGPQKGELLPGEELNKEKLDALKNSLSDVKIADVFRKPKGLDASLKTSGDFLNDREAQQSLAQRGFVMSRDNEIWSANGELQIGMKDGVDYILRFGNVAGEQQDSKEGKLNRYLFVMAKVNEAKFPPPALEELPPEPAPAVPLTPPAQPAAPATPPQSPSGQSEKGAGEKAAETKGPGTGDCGAEDQEASAKDAPAKDAPAKDAPAKDAPAKDAPAKDAPAKDAPAKDAPAKDAPAKAADAKSADTKAPEVKPADSKPAENKPAENKPAENKPAENKTDSAPQPPAANAVPPPATPQSEEEVIRKKVQAERERITKENQRKLDKWKEDKGKAEAKVKELNARFAPWYYVISEDVYKKIHLSRSDVIKEGSKSADEGTGVDAFRKLETEGIKKPVPSSTPAPAFPGGGFPPGNL